MKSLLLLAVIGLLAPAVMAQEQPSAAPAPSPAPATPEPDYVRWVEEDGGDSLQTAIVRFTHPHGETLDLVGAVHIADKAYFQELNRRFKGYDAVLYELVGGPMPVTKEDKEARAKSRETSNLAWVGQMQQTMQRTLELSSQMAEVDYSPPNFVHADMTLEQFNKTKEQKNESFLGLMVKAWLVQSELQSSGKMTKEPDLAQLMAILLSGDSAGELKRIIGSQFDMVEDLITGIEGSNGSVIIGERNNVAIKVLAEQLQLGRKKLAIFYGAAHLPDMEKKLLAAGWKKTGIDWLKAWNLPVEKTAGENK